MYCKHCNEEIPEGTTTHECPKAGLLNVEQDSSFLTSMAIGMLTDNAALGAIMGGDITGGIVGDLLNDGNLL